MLQVRYTANSFADPRRVRFRYRLDGQNHDWGDATDERAAFYTDLKPGDYRFEVKAANPNGVWSESVAMFAFSLAPHFWQTWTVYVVSVVGTVLLAVWLAVAVESYRLRWQRELLKSEERQALADERTRIARDLHDDLGTALTGLALELEVIRRETQGAPPTQERLRESAKHTRSLAERMREVVWAINPRCDNLLSLASFLEQETAQYLGSDGLRGRFEFPDDIPALPLDSQARHQLALSVREALTNVVRHAHASEVVVSLAIQEQPSLAAGSPGIPAQSAPPAARMPPELAGTDACPTVSSYPSQEGSGVGRFTGRALVVEIRDNGRGFQLDEVHAHGHGLASLRERLERIGGCAEWASAPDQGTKVSFRVPLKELPASSA